MQDDVHAVDGVWMHSAHMFYFFLLSCKWQYMQLTSMREVLEKPYYDAKRSDGLLVERPYPCKTETRMTKYWNKDSISRSSPPEKNWALMRKFPPERSCSTNESKGVMPWIINTKNQTIIELCSRINVNWDQEQMEPKIRPKDKAIVMLDEY